MLNLSKKSFTSDCSPVVEVAFPTDQSNSFENLSAKSSPHDSTNYVDSIFFHLDISSPCFKDVLYFRDIKIFRPPFRHGVKCFFEMSLHSFLLPRRPLEIFIELFNFLISIQD